MAEVKNTRKTPAAKKSAQNAADTVADALEQTAPETAVASEQSDTQSVAEPVMKKSSKQSAKKTSSKPKAEAAATNAEDIATEVKDPTEEKFVEQSAQPDEKAVAVEDQNAEENKPVEADGQKADKAAVVALEPTAASEQPAEEKVESVAESKKPAKASGKKFALSKNMIIILSCVLAVVIIGVILAVCLTSCKSNNDNKEYTVTFMVDGDVMTSYKLSSGEIVNKPKNDPSKDMFTFDGWYLVNPNNSNQKQKFEFGTKISHNLTLVAIFTGETSVKVEFDPNGGAFEDSKQVELFGIVGALMTEPEDEPIRVGYIFDGWYTEAECFNKFEFGTYPIAGFTLYAGWAKDTDNFAYISYYGNGELLRVDPVRKDDDVSLPDIFDNSEDIVAGDWLIDNNPNKPYTAGKATVDLNLYVTYYTDGLMFTTTRATATVSGYNGTATDVIVPPMYNGRTVTGIGSYAFYRTGELPAVTSIKLPDTIATIGEGAFYDCQYLTSIDLTYKITSIGKYAFYRNIRLRSVGDISGVSGVALGAGAFNGCKDLREITLGNTLTQIAEYTFNGCSALAKVELPDALTEIGEYAFSECAALKSVALESLILEKIADNAFAGCSSLTEVTIAKTSGEVAMQGNPFADCRNVTVYVPSALLEAYKTNTTNTQFKDKLAAR